MSLRVVIGSANAGKTGVLHQRIRECAAQGGRAALLVPSAPDVTRALAELAPAVPLGLEVRTLDAFLDRLWEQMTPAVTIIGPARRLSILADIVSTFGFSSLAPSSGSPGFLAGLASFVERAFFIETSERPRPHGGVAGELAALLEEYERRLEQERLIERASAHRRVAQALLPELLPDVIAVNRFTGLTAGQELFVTAASAHSEVLVALTYAADVPATAAAADQVRRLMAFGELDVMRVTRPSGGPDELAAIGARLGEAEGSPIVPQGAVVLSEAWGPAAEAARIVREIQNALAEGYTPDTIAVAFRDPARHAHPLRVELAEAGIDTEWDAQVRFGGTRLGRAVLALLSVFEDGADPADLIDVLRTPYAPTRDETLDELDARLRARRAPGVHALDRIGAAGGPATAAFLADARAAVESLGGDGAESAWWHLLAGMIGRAHGGGDPLSAEGRADVAAAAVLLQTVGEMRGLKRGAACAREVRAVLRAMPVTLAPVDRPDAVLVTSVERLRGRRFRCVILGGLTADEFPRPAREDAFSSRRLRSQLALYGVELPQSPTLEDERLMFYQAVTRAQERLVLSWQSHDADGAPRRPSVFLQELLDLYRTNPSDDGLPQGLPRRALSLDELREPEAAPSTDRRILRRLAASGQEATWAEGAERLAHARYRARSRPDRLGPTTRAELASREVFTATEIEAYLHCPFRWYVDHVLHPSELDVEVDAAASGRIAHMILRRVYDEMEARVGARRITPETVTAALEIHTVVAEGVTQSVPSSGPAETANIRRVVRDTARVIAGDATFLPGFEPRYREWSFGLAEGDAPEPLGDFALAGRVDRIDTDGRRLVIVDYKSGRVSSERGRKRLITDGLVQLPLYAAVASRRLGLEVAGGLYRGVREGVRGFLTSGVEQEEPPIVSTDRVNEDDVQELMRQAVARAAEAVAGIRAGEIPARPLHGRCPAWCSARPLCRRSGEACE